MTIQPRSIAAQQNLPTAFEVGIYVDGTLDRVVGYTARKTRGVILDYAFKNGDYILSLLTKEQADEEYKYTKDRGLTFGDKVTIRFTGRTERDAAQSLGKLN